MTEDKDFLPAVIELAESKGWLHFHAYNNPRNKAGFPDLVLVKGDQILWRELKMPGRALQGAQVEWKWKLVAAGANWAIWYPHDLVSGYIAEELNG